MKIELHQIPIRDIVNGYADNDDEGVFGYGGKLNIRPPYQREFVYKDAKRDAVIDTIWRGFPLNVMYWMKNGETFEILDGQQRTISFCQYATDVFSLNNRAWHNLTDDEKEVFLNYMCMVYFCDGTDSEKLAWFKVINIAGAELTSQEMRNAVYAGTWLTDAKRYFSKKNCAAQKNYGDYLNGSAINQSFLETALKWISDGHIEEYMAKNQHEASASSLWLYFSEVMAWVQTNFHVYRSIMRGIDWGGLYNKHGKDKLPAPSDLEKRIQTLLADDDVVKKSGIYGYLLTGNERYLNIRAFTDSQKQSAYARQNGKCALCGGAFDIGNMDGDHITPWSEGGKTVPENLQMLCKDCNRRKGKK